MSSDTVGLPEAHSAQLQSEDATRLFHPTTVISDDAEFGTLVAATVATPYIPLLATDRVTIRIIPISPHYTTVLRNVTTRVAASVPTLLLHRYIGVWRVASDTWLVSHRPHAVRVSALFRTVHFADVESVLSYLAHCALRALHTLHTDFGLPHLYVRPSTLHLAPDATLSLSDPAVYHVLRDSLASRRSFPGTKIWPLPSSRASDALHRADVWDLGIALLELTDGPASVARMSQSRNPIPRLAVPSRWSVQFNNFLACLFSQGDALPAPAELLQHRFVADASPSACLAALNEFLAREETISAPFHDDLSSRLYRENEAVVRSPLITIDDVSTEDFTYDAWKGVDHNRPTVEHSFIRMLKVLKDRPLTTDTEENKSIAEMVAQIETFLDTADMM